MSTYEPAIEEDKALEVDEHEVLPTGPLDGAYRFGWDAPARIATTTEYYVGADE